MKVLGLMGSPKTQGNTDLFLEEALKGAMFNGPHNASTAFARQHNLSFQSCNYILHGHWFS